jgi:hypothetical protein
VFYQKSPHSPYTLDTAKLMDKNATLYKLNELEYLERICDKAGNIPVDAGGSILKNLRELTGGINNEINNKTARTRPCR